MLESELLVDTMRQQYLKELSHYRLSAPSKTQSTFQVRYFDELHGYDPHLK